MFARFDVTKRTSFEHCTEWLTELRNASANSTACKVILVGNKVDLRHLREVTTEEATAFAQQQGLSYIETSASSGHGIDDAFKQLVTELAVVELANTAVAGAQRQLPVGVAPSPRLVLIMQQRLSKEALLSLIPRQVNSNCRHKHSQLHQCKDF